MYIYLSINNSKLHRYNYTHLFFSLFELQYFQENIPRLNKIFYHLPISSIYLLESSISYINQRIELRAAWKTFLMRSIIAQVLSEAPDMPSPEEAS